MVRFSANDETVRLVSQTPPLPFDDDYLVQGIIDDGVALYLGDSGHLSLASMEEAALASGKVGLNDIWLSQIASRFKGALYTSGDGRELHIACRVEAGEDLVREALGIAQSTLEESSWWQANRERIRWNSEGEQFRVEGAR